MDAEQLRDRLRVTLSATYACYMLTLAESRGVDAAQLLANTGLDAARLQAKEARISAWQQAVIVHNLLKATRDPGLAIEIGLRSNLTKAGFIGYGLMSCATVGEAIELGKRFLPIQIPFFKIDLVIEDGMVAVNVREAFPLDRFRSFAIENFLIEVSEIFRSLMIGQVQPENYQLVQLHFDYPEPAYFAAYKDRLPSLHFNQAKNQIRFPAGFLEQPIRTANAALAQVVIAQCEAELARLGFTENWLDRVRALLICREGEYPNLPAIAEALHLSERTLKRKLAELETSFSELLEAARSRDARKLLATTDLSIDEVAARIGYHDRSNFTRAFRRWTGSAPSQFRSKQVPAQVPAHVPVLAQNDT